jgi:hypothetical protein
MSENLQQLITKYQAFYEVSPYHLVVEQGHGSPSATRQISQAGFDVDVHGVSNKSESERGYNAAIKNLSPRER